MRATIKMIAERAGVSIGTVDRVLHDRPYVKPEVRARILEVMEELNYQPNRMASALAMSGISRRLAVVMPDWTGYMQDDIGLGIARFEAEHRDYNWRITREVYAPEEPAQCLALLRRLATEEVHGVALCAADQEDVRGMIDRLSASGVYVTTFNSDVDTAGRLCFVGADARQAGRIAGEIAAKSYRPGDRILVVYAGPKYESHRARMEGFLSRLEERGIPAAVCRVEATHNDYDQTLTAVGAALAEEPELRYIYMANQSVPACIEALNRAGMGRRLPVLCHDNTPEVRELLRSGLVDFTISQDLPFQSYEALSILFRAIQEHRRPQTAHLYSESRILNAENC